MLWHSHYTIGVVGVAGVTTRAVVDTVSHGVASALQDPTTIALGVGVIVAFVVVRERGLKNEAEIRLLRDEHKETLLHLERVIAEIRAEIREALDKHELLVRNVLTDPVLRIGKLETEMAVLNQRQNALEHSHGERT
jgi:hypothetical protein